MCATCPFARCGSIVLSGLISSRSHQITAVKHPFKFPPTPSVSAAGSHSSFTMSSPVKVGTLTYLVAVVGVIIIARIAERMRFISKDSFQ
jgi:hypothetical protein